MKDKTAALAASVQAERKGRLPTARPAGEGSRASNLIWTRITGANWLALPSNHCASEAGSRGDQSGWALTFAANDQTGATAEKRMGIYGLE